MRRQYLRRDPDKNPLGPPAALYARTASPEPEVPQAGPSGQHEKGDDVPEDIKSDAKDEAQDVEMKDATDVDAPKVEPQPENDADMENPQPADSPNASSDPLKLEDSKPETAGPPEEQEQEEPRDWLTLSMDEKLDSMVLLTEWQFQNQARLRQTMKSDDDNATWRVEPIGYDAKSNAYWLIGCKCSCFLLGLYSFYIMHTELVFSSYSRPSLDPTRLAPSSPSSQT